MTSGSGHIQLKPPRLPLSGVFCRFVWHYYLGSFTICFQKSPWTSHQSKTQPSSFSSSSPCVSASSLWGRAAASYEPPPPACPLETDADPPPPQTGACTHPPGLLTNNHNLKSSEKRKKSAQIKQHRCSSLTVCGCAARRQLPQDEAEGVHVDTQEGVPLEVDGAFQDFRSHVAPCSHLQHQKEVKGQHRDRTWPEKQASAEREGEESHDTAHRRAETAKSEREGGMLSPQKHTKKQWISLNVVKSASLCKYLEIFRQEGVTTDFRKLYLSVGVSCWFSCFKLQSQAEVSDARRQIILQQHVLTLNVPEEEKRNKHL